MPNMSPAMIDSHGKPGMAGRTIGVVNAVVAEVIVGVVLATVTVDTDMLGTVVVKELAIVLDIATVDAAVVGVTLTLVVDTSGVVAWVELVSAVPDAVVVTVACCPATGGLSGSKWNMPAKGGVVVPEGPAPTDHPSCVFPDCPHTELRARPGANGKGIAVQICPSQ